MKISRMSRRVCSFYKYFKVLAGLLGGDGNFGGAAGAHESKRFRFSPERNEVDVNLFDPVSVDYVLL